jgi:hypothetical protein
LVISDSYASLFQILRGPVTNLGIKNGIFVGQLCAPFAAFQFSQGTIKNCIYLATISF